MLQPFKVSESFRNLITGFEGGSAWLARLPGLLQACAERWSLRLLPPFDLSYNYVCPARRADGMEVVLKIGLPNPELESEQVALSAYAGRGCVRMLESAPDLSAFLLERLRPGTMLTEIADDEEATHIAAGVMAELWMPPPAEQALPSTRDWANGMARLRGTFDGGSGPFPPAMVDTAERLFAELHASEGPPVLLHGDLHHFNILRAERAPWLALDPKGITGEREYETGALLRNPDLESLNDTELKAVTLRRIDLLSEILGFDRKRLAGWGYAQAVLSAWWSYEDGEEVWWPILRLAEALRSDLGG